MDDSVNGVLGERVPHPVGSVDGDEVNGDEGGTDEAIVLWWSDSVDDDHVFAACEQAARDRSPHEAAAADEGDTHAMAITTPPTMNAVCIAR